jgi:Domain of unknown function (DUF1924)
MRCCPVQRLYPLAVFCAVLLAGAAGVARADSARDAILAQLAAAAKQADPGFSGFSAQRGDAFWHANHGGGKPETPACITCHTRDPRAEGQTRAGKMIQPMAVSKTPDRFTDPAKVEKWFRRNCKTVLGRLCTAVEKGDVITYLSGQ